MAYSRTLNHFTSMQELATIWASSTSYLVNQPVIHNNFLYRCAVAHTSSGSFQTDLAAGNWERVSSAENAINWASGVYYVLNQLVIDNDKLYKCLVAHTSGGSFIADLQSAYWVEISKSEAGVFNYVENADAEVDTLGWNTYADAAGAQPVDGTGGSPTVTFTRSITTPLRGDASFNFAKDAADRQGEGVAYDISIDNADLAKVLTVTFDYEVLSGTYATGDLTVYLIQDPAGTPVVIQPAGYQVQAGTVGTKLKHIATFQTASNVNDYRLCFHVASTSVSAYTLAIDNVVVGPQVVQYGAPVTDEKQASGISYEGLGTVTLESVWERRVGNKWHIRGYLKTGTTSASVAAIVLPSGKTIDTSKISSTTNVNRLGTFNRIETGGTATTPDGELFFDGSTTNKLFFCFQSASNQFTKANGNVLFSSGDGIAFDAEIPILGWSSTVQMSNDTDTRVVAAMYNGHTSTTLTKNVTNIPYATREIDTHGAWNGSEFTCPISGVYFIDGALAITAQVQSYPILYKNGVFANRPSDNRSSDEIKDFSFSIFCNAGDVLSVRVANVGSTTQLGGGYIAISRLSGPSAIAASETVAARYETSASPTVNNTAPTITYGTKIFDTHGAMSGNTYTIPVSGKYAFNLCAYTSSASWTVANYMEALLYKNGVRNTVIFSKRIDGAVTAPQSGNGFCIVDCKAGEQITFKVGTTQSTTLANISDVNYVSILRVGN